MAPYLDASTFHHEKMGRHTESNHAQEGVGNAADSMQSLEAVKAVNQVLNGFISKNAPPTSNYNFSDTIKSCCTAVSHSSSNGQGAQAENTCQGKDSIAKPISRDSISPKDARTSDHAADTKHPNANGFESLSGSPTAPKVPLPVTTNGPESTQIPEPERADCQQGTATTDKPSAGTNGITVANEANGTKNATPGIRGRQTPTSPNNGFGGHSIPIDRLRLLADEIRRSVEGVSPGCEASNKDVAQMKLVAAANELLNAVRPPSDTIMGWFAQMSVVSAVRVFQHWGVFDIIPAQEGGFISFAELAEKIEAEEALLVRMSWMLTSSSVLRYVPISHPSAKSGGLAHTPTSLMLRSLSALASMFQLLHTNIVETSAIMPSYFDTYGRKEPVGPGHIPTSYLAGQPELPYFDLLKQDEDQVKSFMHAMTIAHRRTPITGMFDPENVIQCAELMDAQASQDGNGGKEKRPVWVDIGGSDGSVIKTFREAYPKLKGERCVVQDLPEVVRAAKEAAVGDENLQGVRFLPLDFHKEAPVKGALVYYPRHVVRDYSDPVVINILSNIRKSMIPPSLTNCKASSRILISEQLMPYPAPALFAAFKDYAMLPVGGKERSLQQFQAVAEAAGLVVTGVHRDKATPHAVIEMQVKI